MLSAQQRAGRQRAEKNRRIKMLCARLDRHIFKAENMLPGKCRRRHLDIAEATREELERIDH